MTTPTNWPNPERPGVPMFPERSGRHLVGDSLLFWYSAIQQWVTSSPIQGCKRPEDLANDKYIGPILTPAQIAAMLAGERRSCAKLVKQEVTNLVGDKRQFLKKSQMRFVLKSILQEIRSLGDAL